MDSAALLHEIEQFLQTCREPVLLEPGEEPFALEAGGYTLESRNGRVLIQAWDERRTLNRRVAAVGERKPGKLELAIERFGKREGRLFLIDLARDRAATERRGARLVFREQFRRFLWRRFPDWKIAEISAEPNLEASLSPAYPRAFLKKGSSGWAALACPPEPGAAAGSLTFGLIWLDYLRRRERRLAIEGLLLFLPSGQETAVSLRLPYLDPSAARVTTFVYSESGADECLDPADYGNVDTRLTPCATLCPERAEAVREWIERLRTLPGAEAVTRPDGTVSLRIRGLEFARAGTDRLLFGLPPRTPAYPHHLGEIEALAGQIARVRSAGAERREHPLYRTQPELWLESEVRANLEQVDASLDPRFLYGQVPAFAGGDRGVIDLLAADRSGRLAILELKASEDIHLPLQALDYWLRVKWHLDRGEFQAFGYFGGLPLRPEPPRLLLVAPALGFHPHTETVLRCFGQCIDVERVGVGVEWRKGLKVVLRARGAQRPG